MRKTAKGKAAESGLTIRQAADHFGVSIDTIKQWVRKARFPNSYLEDTPRGPVRIIPTSDINGFERPAMGRPARGSAGNKPTRGRKKKS